MPRQQCPFSEAEAVLHSGGSRIPVGAEGWNMVGRQLLREGFLGYCICIVYPLFSVGLFVLGELEQEELNSPNYLLAPLLAVSMSDCHTLLCNKAPQTSRLTTARLSSHALKPACLTSLRGSAVTAPSSGPSWPGPLLWIEFNSLCVLSGVQAKGAAAPRASSLHGLAEEQKGNPNSLGLHYYS